MSVNGYHGSDNDLIVSVEDRIAWVTFNRPETLNAFGPAQFHRLADTLDQFSVDPDIGVVVLTGNGRAFSAGGDVREFTKKGLVDTGVYALRAITSIRSCRKPVIAMVNGVAVGGGNELVIASDLAIAARSARLGQAGTLIGSCPVLGGTNILPLQIGEKRAKQIVFFSEKVTAEQAFDWGWVNAVVDDAELESTTRQWAQRLLGLHPQALQIAKAGTNVWWNSSYDTMVNGLDMIAMGVPAASVEEGRDAFLEKRPADYSRWH
ncbi:enoyl-CoA hydratase/isomerase family protein [Nocardia sp. NPDC004123]